MADDGGDDGDDMQQVCKVYDSDDRFTAWVQVLLAALALGSLWIKRLHEVPRRKFWTWFMDISKQALGACYAHILNMFISAIVAGNVRGDVVLEDQCAWYAINYLIDTTLGLVLAIAFLRLLDYVANERDWVSLKHSGVYVGTDGLLHWLIQVLAWLAILTAAKVIQCLFILILCEPLAYLGKFVFGPLQSNIRFELLFVMIFFPGLLNVIYFWISDGYLKAQSKHDGAHEPEVVDTGDLTVRALYCTDGDRGASLLGSVDDGDVNYAGSSAEASAGGGQAGAVRLETRSTDRPEGTWA